LVKPQSHRLLPDNRQADGPTLDRGQNRSALLQITMQRLPEFAILQIVSSKL
jgi:hypothetical protein